MEKKIKLIIIGLIGILVISLFINLSTYNAKQVLERQNNDLKKENASLIQKIEAIFQDNRRLEDRISALNADLNRLSQEKEDLQKKLDLVSRERQELMRENNDKFQIVESLKPLKSKNEILRRQLKSLSSRKIDSERNFLEIQKENSRLTNRVSEMETLLEGKSQQIENLKKQLDAFSTGEPLSVEKKESVELPPIVVRPQAEVSAQVAAVELTGRVLALNKDNNFVIIDLGEERGVKVGDTFGVYRDQKNIADIEVIQTRHAIAACDIKKETTPIKVGDTVK